MYYEIMNKQLTKTVSGKLKPNCIFCGKKIGLGDYFCLCRECGKVYYKISKKWRMILPKIIINKIIIKNIKCNFTHSIADVLECSRNDNFDEYGFPKSVCKMYPCKKLKRLRKKQNG